MFNHKDIIILSILAGICNFVDSSTNIALLTDKLLTEIDSGNFTAVKNVVEEAKNERVNMSAFLTEGTKSKDLQLSCEWRAPIHCATEKKNLQIVKFLVEAGADINKHVTCLYPEYHAYRNYTLLGIAVKYRDLDMTKYLIEKGATNSFQATCMRDDPCFQITPLHIAAFQNTTDLVELVLKAMPNEVDVEDSEGYTPLYYSIQAGNLESTLKLMKAGANLNLVQKKGEFNAFHALYSGSQNINPLLVKLFVEKGVDINKKGTNGVTPLLLAITYGKIDLVKALIKNGAQLEPAYLNVLNFFREMTPLFSAVLDGDDEMVNVFLKAGANVSEINQVYGCTVLHAVSGASRNIEPIVTLLLDHGANIEQKSRDGKTPLDRAMNENNVEASKVFIQHGAVVNTTYCDDAFKKGYFKLVDICNNIIH